ncbi:glycine zipper 2TM domain-containing protein [Stenotrophomonas mori]|uniref:Glycine zipper 2TM domain-containing protein n=1 Tax=Stenotrophomonas mori TaxID=2871096 RepID=A0ABT0SFM7_9GAMM|nr:glycine zipper 2TM domain-containing protein [Stenotrophomonas mori]MCL7713809.1 glycine zipper 2TM domain-containing protein [Stenotrophomonas mori]
MKSSTTTVLVAAGALLVGGIATAAFMSGRDKSAPLPSPHTEQPLAEATTPPAEDAAVDDSVAPPVAALVYADVLKVDPVTRNEPAYATVIGTDPVRETSTTMVPREVCEDVVVQERLPERDGNVGGTVAGAVIGGLLGNQVGKGSGRKAATAAGAVAGGVIGNQVDKRHVGGRVVQRTERQCHTEQTPSESSRVTGYNVTYRKADGSTGSMRMDQQPGNRISLGNTRRTIGYDVTYRLNGEEQKIRMDDKPSSDRLPVIDGKVVTRTAAAESAGTRQ